MSLSFRYKRVKRPANTEIKSPSIPVTLFGSGGRYQFIALLDSGADISVVPREVAELLGLDMSGPQEEARGIGGKVPAVETKIQVEVGRPHETYTFTIPVKVILTPSAESDQELPILLGRAGFFDEFVITFNQKEERVVLKKVMR